jgi:hypothetical protein
MINYRIAKSIILGYHFCIIQNKIFENYLMGASFGSEMPMELDCKVNNYIAKHKIC